MDYYIHGGLYMTIFWIAYMQEMKRKD